MKRLNLIFIAAIATLCLASCGDKNEPLSAGSIKSLYGDYLAENQINVTTSDLKVGFFESYSWNEVNYYKCLEKLGIVKVEVQNYQWFTKVTNLKNFVDFETHYYYEGTNDFAYKKDHVTRGPIVTDYVLDYHYMVNVQLTKKGQGMVFVPKGVPAEEPQPEYNVKDFPMDTTVLFTAEPEKVAPALPGPKIVKEFIPDKRKPAVSKKEEAAPVRQSNTVQSAPKAESVRYPLYECMDPQTRDAYEAAKANEEYEVVKMVVSEKKVVEVKDRVVKKEEGEIVAMTAKVVLKTQGITEASHLIAYHNDHTPIVNGVKEEVEVNLVNNWAKGEIDKPEWSVEAPKEEAEEVPAPKKHHHRR